MAWARIDDRFPSHRKVALLSDRAFRLHVSAICWCAENLTDGRVAERELALVAKIRGLKNTAKELEAAGVWDRTDDGWLIHDYLDYNPSRAQVLADRKKNAERQERFRQKNGKPGPPDGSETSPRNGVTDGVTRTEETHGGDTNAARRRHDGDTTATGKRSVPKRESQVTAIRNGVTNDAPCPSPTPVATDVATAASWAERKNGFPDALQPLAKELAAAGLGAVAWDIKKFTDWQRIRNQVERLGVDLMVRSATNAAQQRGEPDSVVAWIGRWESLPDPQAAGRPQLRAVAGGWTGPNRPHPATGAAAPLLTAADYEKEKPF